MGGAVSSGESNDDLIDNLKDAEYIKTPMIEEVFRAVDRAFYYTKPHKKSAYKDIAWKDRNLHLSAPCIYSEVMENLQLKEGMSFLNIGSGTGYLSTMAGLILGRNGINHGIEVHPEVVDYARNRLEAFVGVSHAVDLYEFCEPQFVVGNCLDITKSTNNRYDRIYCGAACPEDNLQAITDLLKIGGICIVPVSENLMTIQRVSESDLVKKALLPVSFATLISSSNSDSKKTSVSLPDWGPARLSELCRSSIRQILRKTIVSVPKTVDDNGTKKRKKKIHERRRANRLLVVQRRRNSRSAEGRENGFVAFAYSMGENSSEEDAAHNNQSMEQQDEAEPLPATSSANEGGTQQPETATPEADHKIKMSKNNSEDSGTESGQGVENPRSNGPDSCSLLQSDIEMAVPGGSGNRDSVPSKSTDYVKDTLAEIINSTGTGTVVENRHAVNGTLENSPSARPNADEENSTFVETRNPTTASILNRIREIIQTRQMERESMRANAADRESRVREQVERVLRDDNNEEFQDAMNDAEDDDVENECVWSSEDTSSSSSSSSDDDSDDYQYAEPIIIGRRRRRADSDNPTLGAHGSSVDHSRSRRSASISAATNNDSMDDSNAQAEASDYIDDGKLGEEPIVFQPVSLEMGSKIQELPLPPPLKKYLNYHREM